MTARNKANAAVDLRGKGRSRTKAEQETIIRWDQEERIAHVWTAYEKDARNWERLGCLQPHQG